MNRPKEGEYWNHKALHQRIFITAVGIRHVLATSQRDEGIYEDSYKISDLEGWYEREEAEKS